MAISDLHDELDILRPNIRRILHHGVKKGDLVRVDKGVYQFKSKDGKCVGVIECADALDAVPRLVAEGKKFDMIILDPPYYSVNLIGRNRLKMKDWYEFVTPAKFKTICSYLPMLLTPKGQVVMFLSSAPSAQKDLQSYYSGLVENSFSLKEKGQWQKVYSNGNSVLSINGKVSPPECITVWQLSPSITPTSLKTVQEWPLSPALSFQAPRGGMKSYRTEKPTTIIHSILSRVRRRIANVLDPFAGSGIVAEVCAQLHLNFHLVEKNPDTINNFIIPRLNAL